MRRASSSSTRWTRTRTATSSSRGHAPLRCPAISSSRATELRLDGRRALQPQAEPRQITLVEDRDHDVVELLGEPNLAVLAPRLALPHDGALDVGADHGDIEVGCQGLAHGPVLVLPQDEFVWLVFPGDAVC